ncbi:hypothetical protein B7R25_13370 [Subtercola boreus]|uniref:Uncharacterized protein n=2 Tax=Subtercola boreus TaxID=120213 RepID=A0A3E0W9P4_9MICO|nr:hypothetical protein B7R24_13270 [Subtercola boreus]RFA19232.1 hypothetical protein B7R23_13250 [Subtercola boreus]RFA25694.1 hypothetical protein B7R25_13370 [Subtercola boreus]
MLVVAVLGTAGCSPLAPLGPPAPSPAPPSVVSTRAVTGFVPLPLTDLTQADVDRLQNSYMTGEFACEARGAFADVSAGSEVQLLDTRGTVLASTTLGDGTVEPLFGSVDTSQGLCFFPFTFPSVTIDQALFRIHVGDAGRASFGFAESAIRRGPIIEIR